MEGGSKLDCCRWWVAVASLHHRGGDHAISVSSRASGRVSFVAQPTSRSERGYESDRAQQFKDRTVHNRVHGRRDR